MRILRYLSILLVLLPRLAHAQQDPDRYTSLMDSAKMLLYNEPGISVRLSSEALEIALNSSDSAKMIEALSVKGNAYYVSGKFESATLDFMETIRLNESLNSIRGMAYSMNNLGAVYNAMGEWSKSIETLQEALRYASDSLPPNLISDIHFNLGAALTETGDTSGAISHYRQSRNQAEQSGDPSRLASVLVNLAVMLRETGELASAKTSLYRAAALADSIEDKNLDMYVMVEMGELYLDKGIADSALIFFGEGKDLAEELGSFLMGADGWGGMARSWSELGEWEKAAEARLMESTLKDSLYNEEKEMITRDLLTKYETERKEKENDLLKKKNSIQKLMIFSIAASLVLLLGLGGFYLYRQRSKRRLELLEEARRAAELQQEITEAELSALRAQINPHFIFNCLNSIQNCLDAGDLDAADTYLAKFSKLLRMMLEFSGRSHISLSDEIRYLSHYIDLERLRFSKSFDYEIEWEGDENPDNIEIPTLIVQPYVENAIKHGLTPLKEGGHLKVRFVLGEDDNMRILVEDNGIGRDRSREQQESSGPRHRSMGMEITRSRIEKLNEGFNEKDLLKITDLYDAQGAPAGTRIEILIPA